MKMVCISKSYDLVVGLRLAGIESFLIKDNQEITRKIAELAKMQDVGILNVTEDVYEVAQKQLQEIQNQQNLPLIVVIPNTKLK